MYFRNMPTVLRSSRVVVLVATPPISCAVGTITSSSQYLGNSFLGITAIVRPGINDNQVGQFEDFDLGVEFGKCYAYTADQQAHGVIEVKVFFTPEMTVSDQGAIRTFLRRQSIFTSVSDTKGAFGINR
jgi:hypothetical protein